MGTRAIAWLHEVGGSSRTVLEATDRYSVPFFFNPSADATICPVPSMVSSDRPARYRPIEWIDFRSRRTEGDYADYGPEVQIAQFRIDE